MKVNNENLDILIEGLSEYKKKGVIDPWVLDDGTTIEPLDVLIELRELRKGENEWKKDFES
jgi:hypothetical protein